MKLRSYAVKLRLYAVLAAVLITLLYISGCSSSGSSITTDDPEKAFSYAKRKFDRGDFTDAIEDFSLLKIRFPGTDISDRVQYYLALSYYRQKEFVLAAYEFETFLKYHPLSPLYPEGKYMLGSSYYELSPKPSLDQEYTREAMNQLLSYIEMFPEDKNVPEAEKKIKSLRNKLAYKDFFTAELYMKVDNYRAAALYFQNVYENYIDSDWADDAMVGQAEAYVNAVKYSEANKVLERFYKLFPNSNQKAKADRLKRKILEM